MDDSTSTGTSLIPAIDDLLRKKTLEIIDEAIAHLHTVRQTYETSRGGASTTNLLVHLLNLNRLEAPSCSRETLWNRYDQRRRLYARTRLATA